MDVLYFAFANDQTRPLNDLKREETEIRRLLEPFDARGEFKLIVESFASIETVVQKLSLYKRDLVLFHFGGHAGPDHLGLEDESAHAQGVAALLQACPKLEIIVLNGCATALQVNFLLKISPLVIATNSPISDPAAATFATSLYRSLSYSETIEEAFSTARGHVLALNDELVIGRSIGAFNKVSGIPTWGRFIREGREDILDWRLPVRKSIVPEEFVPNQLLIDTMLETLASYDANIAQVVANEENGQKVAFKNKRRAVLNLFPKPIAEPIRFLIVRQDPNNNAIGFFDEPGPDRLQLMVTLFCTVTELMAFIMLSQLWDALNNPGKLIIISERVKTLIQELLVASASQRKTYNYISLTQEIRRVLDANNEFYFVEELKGLSDNFKEGNQFYEACRFFQNLKTRYETLGQEEATMRSILAEEQLSIFLKELGFMARYQITSVKNIDLLKYRHELTPNYRHRVVKVDDDIAGPEEELDTHEWHWDSSSVLLLKKSGSGGKTTFLNLTPFVIDENAFDEKAMLGKLHFFERFVSDDNTYLYRPVTCNPKYKLLVIDKNENHQILKAQFNAFTGLLFNQKMRSLK